MTGALSFGTEISKGIKEQDPTSVFDLEKNARKTAEDIPQLFDV